MEPSPTFLGSSIIQFNMGLNADTGLIDYEQVESLAIEHKPAMIIAGFSAYSGIMDWARFREIADKVGAYLLVEYGACIRFGCCRCLSKPNTPRSCCDIYDSQDLAWSLVAELF